MYEHGTPTACPAPFGRIAGRATGRLAGTRSGTPAAASCSGSATCSTTKRGPSHPPVQYAIPVVKLGTSGRRLDSSAPLGWRGIGAAHAEIAMILSIAA